MIAVHPLLTDSTTTLQLCRNPMSMAACIDIHCHILPAVDDGPDMIEASLKMAGMLAAGGVSDAVATPHHIAGTAWSMSAAQIRERVSMLQERLDRSAVPLTLHTGMEIALHPHLLKEMEHTALLPLGRGNWYLLEPPFQLRNEELLETVFSFKNTGKDVILAHPERIPFFQQNSASLIRLVEQGILIQVNVGSLLGEFGETTKKTACYLIEQQAVHCVASDAHGPDSRRPPTRAQWQQLEQVLGADQAKLLCVDNPGRILGLL